MKKLFLPILVAIPSITAQIVPIMDNSYITTVIFSQEKTEKADTFFFELRDQIKECSSITSDDFIELSGPGKSSISNIIWYNNNGVTSYIDYFGDFHCWAPILYNRKRLYLSANKKVREQ